MAQLLRTSERCKLLGGNSRGDRKSAVVYLRRRKYSRGSKFPFTISPPPSPSVPFRKSFIPLASLWGQRLARYNAAVSLYRKITPSVKDTGQTRVKHRRLRLKRRPRCCLKREKRDRGRFMTGFIFAFQQRRVRGKLGSADTLEDVLARY